MEVLLSVASGKNYATSIAEYLKKKQPTVTEQLKVLESHQLIRVLKRSKAKEYEVNWNILLEIFYDVVKDTIENRKGFLMGADAEKLEGKKLEEIVPTDLIKIFFTEYLPTFRDLGGKKKGFDELTFSFFSAINNLEERYSEKLKKKFDIDEEVLYALANLMEFEISGIEETAIASYLEIGEGDTL